MDCGKITDQCVRIMPDCTKVIIVFIISRIISFNPVNLILQLISFSVKDKSAASISAGRLRYVLAIVVVTVPVNMEPQLDSADMIIMAEVQKYPL